MLKQACKFQRGWCSVQAHSQPNQKLVLDFSQYNHMRLAGAQPKYNTVIQDRAHMRVKHRIGPLGPGMSPLLLKKILRPKYSFDDSSKTWNGCMPDLGTLGQFQAASERKRTLMLVHCSFFLLINASLSTTKIIGQIRAFFSFYLVQPPWAPEIEASPAAWPNSSYVPERYCLYYQARPPGVIPPARAALPRVLPWQQ